MRYNAPAWCSPLRRFSIDPAVKNRKRYSIYRRIYMSLRKRACGRLVCLMAIIVLGLTSSAVLAQDQPVPKVDVFGGYSWYDPGLRVNGLKLDSNAKGFGVGITYNFNKNFGFTLDGAGHFGSESNSSGQIMVGPRFKFRQE